MSKNRITFESHKLKARKEDQPAEDTHTTPLVAPVKVDVPAKETETPSATSVPEPDVKNVAETVGWPLKLREIFGSLSERVSGNDCPDFQKCRRYDEIKDLAIDTAHKNVKLGDIDEVYYIQTQRKSLVENDSSQFLFAVLPRDHDSYTPTYHPQLFSICVNVNRAEENGNPSAYYNNRCPLDKCNYEEFSKNKPCHLNLDAGKTKLALKGQKNGQTNANPASMAEQEAAFDKLGEDTKGKEGLASDKPAEKSGDADASAEGTDKPAEASAEATDKPAEAAAARRNRFKVHKKHNLKQNHHHHKYYRFNNRGRNHRRN